MLSNYSAGDVNLRLKITSEKEVTIDDVVTEATEIWRKSKKRKINFGDSVATEALMADIRREHPEFCKSYPIVQRYICQMQEYDAKTFRLWLKKIQQHPWRNEDEYLAAQSDYVTMLFRRRHPRANTTQINNIRANILALLKHEHAMFKHYAEETSKEVTAEENVLRERSASELRAFVALAGLEGIANAETIRAESDVKQPLAGDTRLLVDALAADITPCGAPGAYLASDLLS